jgi:putative transposase
MAKQGLRSLHHCVYRLQYHLVLTTKDRRRVITDQMKERLAEIFRQTLQKWDCSLIEFNGEADHVHLLFEANPTIALSKLVNNLKTVSSRLMRRDFPSEIGKVYVKPVFWHRSYCILSCGGAPISVIRRYIENQGHEK